MWGEAARGGSASKQGQTRAYHLDGNLQACPTMLSAFFALASLCSALPLPWLQSSQSNLPEPASLTSFARRRLDRLCNDKKKSYEQQLVYVAAPAILLSFSQLIVLSLAGSFGCREPDTGARRCGQNQRQGTFNT